MSMRETRGHHLQAANTAFSYADHLDQLSRPVGRTAEVWLGRAAVAAEMKDPAAALNDLERALIQLRGNAKVGVGVETGLGVWGGGGGMGRGEREWGGAGWARMGWGGVGWGVLCSCLTVVLRA